MTPRTAIAPPGREVDRSRLSRHAQEWLALHDVERAAREYAAITHGNLSGEAYHRREEARDRLLDALATLDVVRQKVA